MKNERKVKKKNEQQKQKEEKQKWPQQTSNEQCKFISKPYIMFYRNICIDFKRVYLDTRCIYTWYDFLWWFYVCFILWQCAMMLFLIPSLPEIDIRQELFCFICLFLYFFVVRSSFFFFFKYIQPQNTIFILFWTLVIFTLLHASQLTYYIRSIPKCVLFLSY